MAIFYQHIGRVLWARDAPKSIGVEGELRCFRMADLERYLPEIPQSEIADFIELEEEIAPTGFQIWGLPSGAERVVSRMVVGDYLLLLESDDFTYIGQIIHRISAPSWTLSDHIWGEQRFPIIVFLQGQLINFSWERFKEIFSISPNIVFVVTQPRYRS